MEIENVVAFLNGLLAVLAASFIGWKTLKAAQRNHRQQQKNRVIDFFVSIPANRNPSEQELAAMNHAFCDYANVRADSLCLWYVLNKKDNPFLFECLAIAGPWVKFDSILELPVRAKGSVFRDKVKRAFAIIVYLVTSMVTLWVMTQYFGDYVESLSGQATWINAVKILITIFSSMLPVFFVSLISFPVIKRVDSINELIKK